jgi:hypothetical protein
MPARKPLTVQVPSEVAGEIEDAARRTQRSVAFIVRRALGAAPNALPVSPTGEKRELVLATGEDDPADTPTKIKSLAKGRSLDDAITAAWTETRARFHAWIAREESVGQAEHADHLDTSLRDAQDPKTAAARLIALASSEYPKVRALVAIHAACPADVLTRLAQDKEPYVRDAVENRKLKG